MQNQNLLTQEFSNTQVPKPGNLFSLNNLLYLAAAVGTGAIMFELYSIWTFKLAATVISTFGIIGWLIARQVLALKQQMTLLKEQEVINSDMRFQAMVENSSDMITIRDHEGNLRFRSSSIKNILGYEPDEYDNRASYDLIHQDDLGAIRESSEALARGEIDMFQIEYRCRHKDGSWRTLEGIARKYDDETIDLHGIIVNSRDITDRKTAEKQLRSYNFKLEQSNRELQEFAYVASHDLQEPLRKVQAFGDRLEKKCAEQLSDEGRDYVSRMKNAAGRMQNLINDLLTFSRVATKIQPFQPVSLKRIAEEVVSDLEVRVEQTQGRVEIGELPVLEADALQMRQLFQNLIGNALKFHRADEVPVVKIFAETVASNGASVQIGGEEVQIGGNDNFCRIVVEDNGIGFDEKYLDRIFTVFQRLHGRTDYEGSGIGLAVCRKIVERHGGQITATSKPGAGAKFYIDLPVAQEEDMNIHETKY
ncbi:MAG TPA: ATP-binding protein [Pyrinomonadaceae bacterium]|jgi:PAS domain S-box-containing protein|nr:ATP-binding protein [Pyrinomonadaceae bacterium]